MLQSFVDQAEIAIENVRLFNETREALEQQTATSEILQVISASPTDAQPVFDAIVQSGLRLFGGMDVSLNMRRGDVFDRVALAMSSDVDDIAAAMFPLPVTEQSIAGRVMLRSELVQIFDIRTEPWLGERARAICNRLGFRSALSAPVMRNGEAIGAIIVFRDTPGWFENAQISLLKTFADQAVIAIHNARLFKELEARNRDVTTALEQDRKSVV